MGENAAGLFALGFDVPSGGNGDCTRIAAARTGAAEANPDSAAACATARGDGRDIEATIAATAANRLADDADGLISFGIDGVVDGEIDKAGIARAAAAAAEADANSAAAACEGDTAGDVEAAIASTAADGLGEDAGGLFAKGPDVAAGKSADFARIVARTAIAAEADADSRAPCATAGKRAGDIETAVAAAAAKRLNDIAGGTISTSDDLTRGPGIDVSAETAAAALAAEANGDTCTANARAGQRTGDIEAAVAATAADGLN